MGETALLAGLIRAPNRLSPYRSAEAATKRRNVVLAKLARRQDYHASSSTMRRMKEKLLAASCSEGH